MCSCRRISTIHRCGSNVDRLHAAKLGLTEREVLANVITSLTSNQMIAPNLWIDTTNGNNYFLTVQYPEAQIRTVQDLESIPLHADGVSQPTRLDMVASIERIQAPTEVDHYQIRRKLDIYVRPATENLGSADDKVRQVLASLKVPANVNVAVRGSAEAMNASFRSFSIGLTLSVILLYLILVAQFRSFIDPAIILLALAARHHRRSADACAHRHNAERHVSDGSGDAGRHRHVEQHSDRRVRAPSPERRTGRCGSRDRILPRASAADSDDIAGDDHRIAADGFEARRRQ